jgi:hypothetical protein
MSGEGSSIDDRAREVRAELKDQLDEAPTKETKEGKIRELRDNDICKSWREVLSGDIEHCSRHCNSLPLWTVIA